MWTGQWLERRRLPKETFGLSKGPGGGVFLHFAQRGKGYVREACEEPEVLHLSGSRKGNIFRSVRTKEAATGRGSIRVPLASTGATGEN